jgi:hypothetical protein
MHLIIGLTSVGKTLSNAVRLVLIGSVSRWQARQIFGQIKGRRGHGERPVRSRAVETPRITICGIGELGEHSAAGVTHVL